jgi:hypothetical protein
MWTGQDPSGPVHRRMRISIVGAHALEGVEIGH